MKPTDRISPISFYDVELLRPAASWRGVRRALLACALICALALIAAQAGAPSAAAAPSALRTAPVSAGVSPIEAQTLDMLLELLPARYASAHAAHDPASAAPVRLLARAVRDRVRDARSALDARSPRAGERATGVLDRLVTALAPTADAMLDMALAVEPNSRLSCQVICSDATDGIKVTVAPE